MSVVASADAERVPNREPSAAVCHHCGLSVPAGLVDASASQQFCCSGCRVAYETIHGCGLDDYYAVRDRLAKERKPAKSSGQGYTAFDSSVFLDQHAVQLSDGLESIDFYVDGVHCAACVWLVERLPQMIPGVLQTKLSLASSTARVVWDPEACKLSRIAEALDRLGYTPHPARDAAASKARTLRERTQLSRMAVAGALAGNNMLIALALYAGVFDGIEPQFALLFRWISMGLGWVSLAWPGRVFFKSAWASLSARTVNLDVPICLAIGVGAVAGTANVLLNRGDIYFDSLSVLVFLLLVGRFIQTRQQRWAREAVGRMLSLTPASCRVVRGAKLKEEPIEALSPGDVVEVRAGEIFPADGVVCSGRTSVDRAVLTGESLPQPLATGDSVNAGSQNISATVRVSVTKTGSSTRVGQLMQVVEQGMRQKPEIVQFTDRVAGWFVVIIVVLALINFASWLSLQGVSPAIDTTVALLIVACPCALGLATPLTMAIGIGQASRNGILVKSASVLETLGRKDFTGSGQVLLDKTGTLTHGKLKVTSWHGDASLRSLVAHLEAESNHPIAEALRTGLPKHASRQDRIWQRIEHHGRGVSASCSLGTIEVGSIDWLVGQAGEVPILFEGVLNRAQQQGQGVVGVCVDHQWRAVVCLADSVREDASAAISALHAKGWSSAILSGDAEGPVMAVAGQLGIETSRAHSQLLPEAKLAHVTREKDRYKSQQGPVVMVGDGVNDAAALSMADVGIAVHGGAEAALAAADVYVSKPGVAPLIQLFDVSSQTVRVARRNLAISLAYNTIAVSLAAAGLLTPLVAAVLMPISSATVLGAAIYGLSGSHPKRVLEDGV